MAQSYDLTGGVFPEAQSGDALRDWTNCHAMSIDGKYPDITYNDLLSVAARYNIGTATTISEGSKDIFGGSNV